MSNPCYPENDTAENRLKKTVFVVEATSFEQHTLWRDFSDDNRLNPTPDYPKVKWEQMDGWLVTVGKLGKRPCCVSMSWVRINGQLVMFYDQCSQVTDSLQTEKWLEKHFKGMWDNGLRRAYTDATNFSHALAGINEANGKL